MANEATREMDEILKRKRSASRENGRRGGIRFLGWGFGGLSNDDVARDFCAVQSARQSGSLKPELVSSFGF